MQRFVIALLLLAALVCGSVWSMQVVEDTVDEVAGAVQAGQAALAYARWTQARPLLGSLLMHNEIDHAELLFVRLLAGEDGPADRAELLAQLHHLSGLQRPSVANLL